MKRALELKAPGWARLGPNDRADLWLELRQMLPLGPESALDACLNHYEGAPK